MTETITAADMLPPTPAPADTPAPPSAPAPEGQDPPATPEATEPAPKPAHEPWYQQRIRQQAARVAAEQSRAERAERELEVLRAASQARANPLPDQQGQAQPTPVPIQQGLTERDVETRAAQIAAQRAEAAAFNAKCDDVFHNGRDTYPDFAEKLASFGNLGGLEQHIDFVRDVITLPNASAVLYSLANDLDHAAHVLALPPRQQAMALATLSTTLAGKPGGPEAQAPSAPAAPPPVTASRAPPPTKPIAGRGSQGPADIYDPRISMSDYIKLRAKG